MPIPPVSAMLYLVPSLASSNLLLTTASSHMDTIACSPADSVTHGVCTGRRRRVSLSGAARAQHAVEAVDGGSGVTGEHVQVFLGGEAPLVPQH